MRPAWTPEVCPACGAEVYLNHDAKKVRAFGLLLVATTGFVVVWSIVAGSWDVKSGLVSPPLLGFGLGLLAFAPPLHEARFDRRMIGTLVLVLAGLAWGVFVFYQRSLVGGA